MSSNPGTDSGMGRDPAISYKESLILSGFLAVAFYNTLELNVLIFTTFKSCRGLYFWSILASTWGVPIWSLGYLFADFALVSSRVPVCILVPIGWCAMVTGQSMVLYSRLHFLLVNDAILRAVLAMIIVDAVVGHIPTIVMGTGANSSNPTPWLLPYTIYEKVEVSIFSVQELVISTIYLVYTLRLSRDLTVLEGNRARTRRLLRHLVAINAIVIAMDVSILVIEFLKQYAIQTAWKGLVYSVKLKLEFRVLTAMVCLARTGQRSSLGTSRSTATWVDVGPVERIVETKGGLSDTGPSRVSCSF